MGCPLQIPVLVPQITESSQPYLDHTLAAVPIIQIELELVGWH